MWLIGIDGLLVYVFIGIVIGMLIEHYKTWANFVEGVFDTHFGEEIETDEFEQ